MATPQVWFTSDRFEVEPSEDDETNPELYGRALAHWLAGALAARGCEVEPPFPEDWGWLTYATLDSVRLGVGCANETGSITRWSCIAYARGSAIVRLFRGSARTNAALSALCGLIADALASIDARDVEWEGPLAPTSRGQATKG